MNFSFYLFGTPEKYDSYPYDFNSELFQYLAKKRQDDSQLTVYRNGPLIYYVYIRYLPGNNNYFGICLVFNGVYCSDKHKLFYFFQTAISEIAKQGKMLGFTANGNLFIPNDMFYLKHVEIERLRTYFQRGIDSSFKKDFVPFNNSFRLENNLFKTIYPVRETFFEYDGNFCFMGQHSKKRKKQFAVVTAAIISVVIIVALVILSGRENPIDRQKRTLMIEGDNSLNKKEYVTALEKYREAERLDDSDTYIKTKILKVTDIIDAKFNEEKKIAYDDFKREWYNTALFHCDEALSFRKDNKEMVELKKKIEQRINKK